MQVRAYHMPTRQWRWAVMGQDNKYVRLDPHEGEHLSDFNVYEVTIVGVDDKTPHQRTEQFSIKRSLNHLPRVLS